MQNVNGIVIARRTSGDESLLLETLLETGNLQSFKLPGIAKSKKRSPYHFTPGTQHRFIFAEARAGLVIPRSSELVFSPFSDRQDYALLAAVAELIYLTPYIKASHESGELFLWLSESLQTIAAAHAARDVALNRAYWRFLEALGLAAHTDEDLTRYVGYDLNDGFLSAAELAARPHSDCILPMLFFSEEPTATDAALWRETIRRYLQSI